MSDVRILPDFEKGTNEYYDTMAITVNGNGNAFDISRFLKERGYGTERRTGNIVVIKVMHDGNCSMDQLKTLVREFCSQHDLEVVEHGILQEEEPAA